MKRDVSAVEDREGVGAGWVGHPPRVKARSLGGSIPDFCRGEEHSVGRVRQSLQEVFQPNRAIRVSRVREWDSPVVPGTDWQRLVGCGLAPILKEIS